MQQPEETKYLGDIYCRSIIEVVINAKNKKTSNIKVTYTVTLLLKLEKGNIRNTSNGIKVTYTVTLLLKL